MDNSPTALFDSYEQDFKQIIQSIRGKLDGDAQDAQGEQRKAALRRVEMELDEADEMVRGQTTIRTKSDTNATRSPPSTGFANGD